MDRLDVQTSIRPGTLETFPEEDCCSPLESPFELMPVSPVPPAIPAVLSPVPLSEYEMSPVQDAPLLSMPSSSLSSVRVSSLDVSSLPSVLLSPDSVLSDAPSPERCKAEDSLSSASLDLLLPIPDKPESLPSLSPVQASSNTESSSPDFSFPLEGVQQITLPPAISPIPSPVHLSTAPPSDASDLFFTDSSKTLEDATSLVESDLSSLDAFLARPIQGLMDVTPARTPSDGAEAVESPSKCSYRDGADQDGCDFEPVRFSNFQFFSPPDAEEVSEPKSKLSQPPEKPLLDFDEPPVNSKESCEEPDPLDALSQPVRLLFHDALTLDVCSTSTNYDKILSPKSPEELIVHLVSVQPVSDNDNLLIQDEPSRLEAPDDVHSSAQTSPMSTVQTATVIDVTTPPECPTHLIPSSDAFHGVPSPTEKQTLQEIPDLDPTHYMDTVQSVPDECPEHQTPPTNASHRTPSPTEIQTWQETASPDLESVRGVPDGQVPDLLLNAAPIGSLSMDLSSPSDAALPDVAPVTPPRALSPLSPLVERGGGPRKRWSIASCGGEGGEEGAERRARALQVIQENSEMLQRIVQQPPPGAAWGRAQSEERPYSPFPRPRRPASREAGLRLGLYPK